MARAWTFCADVMTLPLEPLEPLSSLDSRAGRHYYVWETVICDGMPVEIVTSYTYLGILLSDPLLRFQPTAKARDRVGHVALVQMERGCTAHHIHDPQTRCRPLGVFGLLPATT